MVLQNIIYLTNSSVNNGVALAMNAKDLNSNQSIMTNTINKPRQSVGTDYTTNLSTATNTGFANPTHTLNGVINLSLAHGSTTIDVEFAKAIILNCHNSMTLRCDKFKTTTNTNGDINVMLTGYSDALAQTNVLNYTMVFIEVKV